jgi:hypothetical protein
MKRVTFFSSPAVNSGYGPLLRSSPIVKELAPSVIVLDMKRGFRLLVWAISFVGCTLSGAAGSEWLFAFPAGQREAVSQKLDEYAKLNKARNWGRLYDFVCATALGGVNRQTFISKMTAAHGTEIASAPDLLAFRPSRVSTYANRQYDIYGCARAKREGREYNGIAVTHIVFERGTWLFAGWSFTEFPNVPCKALADPSWKALGAMEWRLPMEELRDAGGASMHIDKPKK